MAPQFVDSLQIPGHTDKIPFPVNRFDPSERKLSKSKHRFDDPKNRFWRTLALGIDRATRRRLQPVFHLLHFMGILTGWTRACQEFLEFQRVTFSLHCNIGSHFFRYTTLDIGLAEVSIWKTYQNGDRKRFRLSVLLPTPPFTTRCWWPFFFTSALRRMSVIRWSR